MRTLGKSSQQYESRLQEYCIDMSERWLVTYWADALGVSFDALVAASRAVGTNLDTIDSYLAGRHNH